MCDASNGGRKPEIIFVMFCIASEDGTVVPPRAFDVIFKMVTSGIYLDVVPLEAHFREQSFQVPLFTMITAALDSPEVVGVMVAGCDLSRDFIQTLERDFGSLQGRVKGTADYENGFVMFRTA